MSNNLSDFRREPSVRSSSASLIPRLVESPTNINCLEKKIVVKKDHPLRSMDIPIQLVDSIENYNTQGYLFF